MPESLRMEHGKTHVVSSMVFSRSPRDAGTQGEVHFPDMMI